MLFDEKGSENTDHTVGFALKKTEELGISHIVVASGSGSTAEKLTGKGKNIVCVTSHFGFIGPGQNKMSKDMRAKLIDNGVEVLATTHLLAGVDRSLRFKFQGVYPAEIIATTLKIFGDGLKVCVEISVMALDAGLIPYGKEIIAVAGSKGGADTAIVVVPDHSQNIFNTEIKEIICMPRNKKR